MRLPWPRVNWYVDAVSEERLSEETRSVSLLARWSPILADSGSPPDDMAEEGDEEPEAEPLTGPCIDNPQRFSGPIV